MTFYDIFKTNFLDSITSFSLLDTVIALGLAFVLGLFIFLIYKKTFNGVMYSSGFGLSLVAIALITTMIILAISSNVVLSLGMVGALSIVRFRTAVKEPMDIAFVFWSISSGIVLGAGYIPLAVFGSLFIGIVLVVFANVKGTGNPYLLIVGMNTAAAEESVMSVIKTNAKKHLIKSKTVSSQGVELTIEVRLQEMSTSFVNMVERIDGVDQAVLVSYNGDYMA